MTTNKIVTRTASDAMTPRRALSRRQFLRVAALGVASVALANAGLAIAEPSASAETLNALSNAQAEYEAAMSQLSSLTQQAELAQYALSETQAAIEQTDAQIAELEASITENQAKLSEAQDTLADRVDASYKTGGTNILSVLLDASSFEDLVNRVYYAGKVSDADAQAIQEVKDLKAELEQQEADLRATREEQEQLLAQQQQEAQALDDQVSAMQSYAGSLSDEVVALMSQAQQEQLAAQEAQYQAYLASLEQQGSTPGGSASSGGSAGGSTSTEGGSASSGGSTSGATGGDQGTQGGQSTDSGTTTPDASEPVEEQPPVDQAPADEPTYEEPSYDEPVYEEPVDEPTYDEPVYDEPVYDEPAYEEPSYSGTGNHVGSVVDVAWNYVGNVYYLWGGTSPDTGFDCSGLAQYCYSMCGYYIGRTTYDQIAQIQSLGNWRTDMSQLYPGDLVFPHSGHVGIYCGGGMMIHAPYEGQPVTYASVYAFMGGGSPV